MADVLKHWYALYTRSRAEKKVASLIEETTTEVYLPLQKTMKIWSDRRKMVHEPLFRSYIFVRCGKYDFDKVLKIPGAVCFVSFSGEKVVVPDFQIEAVRTFLGEQDMPQYLEYFQTVCVNWNCCKCTKSNILFHYFLIQNP